MFKINFIYYSHRLALWMLVLLVLGACSTLRKPTTDGPPAEVDGPPVDYEPVNNLPADAIPRQEPLSKYGNPPSYVVFGKTYHTLTSSQGFVQRGIASWYGKKFHGRRTSSGEPYDMYGMTAAHTQLPLPTYVQVTNLKNGKQVVLRVNDRGPFHGNRVIDLSYTAAKKLDIVKQGTGLVEVRALDPRNYRLANNAASTSTGTNETANKQVGSSQNIDIRTEAPAVISGLPSESGSVAMHESAIDMQPVEYTDEDSVTTVSNHGPQVFVQVGAFGDRENAAQLKRQLSELKLGEVTISSIVQDSKQLHRVRIGPLATVKSADDTVNELNSMGMSDHRVVIE